jgi:hypothetical protein
MTRVTAWMVLAATLTAAPLVSCEPTCEVKVIQEILSPDRAYKATVYSSLCGYNIASNTQVSIVPVSEAAGGRSEIFGANASGAEAARGPYGGPLVSARWMGNRTLEITYDTAGSVVRREERYKNFTVRYRALTGR